MHKAMVVLLLAGISLAGCLSETPEPETEDDATSDREAMPVAWEPVTAFGAISSVDIPNGGGQGIWITGDTLYVTNGGDLHVYDATDRLEPVLVGSLEDVGARDVDIMEWQGRTYALLAGSGLGMHIVDVTDGANPTLVTTMVLPSAGVHNLAVVEGTPFVYSSGASGQERRIDVLDLTEPANPTVHTFPIPLTMQGRPIQSDGCHDISVRVDLGRAYCAGGGGYYTAGGGESFIWDISEDPTNPVWLGVMDDPRIAYHHQAFANESGELLIVNDEFIAPNCHRAESPLPGAFDPQVPTGAAWVWDISDETSPVLRSVVQNPAGTLDEEGNPDPTINCGSHFGDAIPNENKFVMGWYQGGTMLVSYEDPDNPVILDILEPDGSTWESMVHERYVYHSSSTLQVTPFV